MSRTLTRITALGGMAASVAFPAVVLAQDRPAIRLGGLPEDSATSVLYAIRTGAFKRAGLDVTIEGQRSGSAVASGVAGGAYQIGKISMNPLIDAHAKGIPFVIVAGGGLCTPQNPLVGLMTKPGSPIKAPQDLVGKTVGVGSLNDMFSLTMRSWMYRHGADPTTLKMIEIPISALGDAIASGRIDAGAANEPVLSGTLATGKVQLISRMSDAIAPRFLSTVWCANATWADANRSVCQRFARVVHDAALYINAHPAQTVDDIATFTGIDPAVVRKMTRTEAASLVDASLIQPVIDVLVHFRDIPVRFDARELIWS